MIKLKNILYEIDSLGYIDWGDPVAARQRRGDTNVGEAPNEFALIGFKKWLHTKMRSGWKKLSKDKLLDLWTKWDKKESGGKFSKYNDSSKFALALQKMLSIGDSVPIEPDDEATLYDALAIKAETDDEALETLISLLHTAVKDPNDIDNRNLLGLSYNELPADISANLDFNEIE